MTHVHRQALPPICTLYKIWLCEMPTDIGQHHIAARHHFYHNYLDIRLTFQIKEKKNAKQKEIECFVQSVQTPSHRCVITATNKAHYISELERLEKLIITWALSFFSSVSDILFGDIKMGHSAFNFAMPPCLRWQFP